MGPQELLTAGRLGDAIQALSAEVRSHPVDPKRRTFLFELLCFAGDYERAGKHLQVLAPSDRHNKLGALLYHAAMHADGTRQKMFTERRYPAASEVSVLSGTWNGRPFQSLSDSDPRIGPRLEVFAGDAYMWIPLNQIASLEAGPPQRLRDLLWLPAVLKTGARFQGGELGDVLIPALAPHSWSHGDEAVRLGRVTLWEDEGDGEPVPFGQKLFQVDEEEAPLLGLRRLEIHSPA